MNQEKLTISSIINFLKNEARTEIAHGFCGTVNISTSSYNNHNSLEFELSPGDRQRQDHWHFYYDGDEDYAWEDWQENWANVLQHQTEQALKEKFPLLNDCDRWVEITDSKGEGCLVCAWSVGVGEKGHVYFEFNKAIVELDL